MMNGAHCNGEGKIRVDFYTRRRPCRARIPVIDGSIVEIGDGGGGDKDFWRRQ